MKMKTRCKFKCNQIEDYEDGCMVYLGVVVDGSPENEAFFNYTPSGTLSVGLVRKEEAHEFFKVGSEYYLDIILAHNEA